MKRLIKISNTPWSNIGVLALSAVIFSGCAAPAKVARGPSTGPSISQPTAPKPLSGKGLETVLGLTAQQLERSFGKARLDVREANGRKLQFSGSPCILDVYLYAKNGSAEVVTHVDARRSDGAAVDRASCVKALTR